MRKKKVIIERTDWQTLLVEIAGQPPGLLQNQIKPDAVAILEAKALGEPAPKNVQKGARTAEELTGLASHDRDESHCHPASGFHKAMVSAASSIKSITKVAVRAQIQVSGHIEDNGLFYVSIDSPGWDVRRDVIINQKTTGGASAAISFRPWFREWSAIVPVQYAPDAFSASEVVDLLSVAGEKIGVGCWRPETGGRFGRFSIEGSE